MNEKHTIIDTVVDTTRYWWVLALAGAAWILVAFVILRFDYTTAVAISVLFGVFAIGAAVNEFVIGALSAKLGWRILHWLLGLALAVVGVLAFFRPSGTFVALAAVMSFYFVFRGAVDIAVAFLTADAPGWWVLLLTGLAELLIGFWAAGSWNLSVIVLVSWVAAGALLHGIGEIAFAFLVRKAGSDAKVLTES